MNPKFYLLPPVSIFINPQDPRADEIRAAARSSGLAFTATSAYSGVTEAEFDGVRVSGAEEVLFEFRMIDSMSKAETPETPETPLKEYLYATDITGGAFSVQASSLATEPGLCFRLIGGHATSRLLSLKNAKALRNALDAWIGDEE